MAFQKNLIIDKDYVPEVGDVLSNEGHPLIIIEDVYHLEKKSLRVNRNYNDQLVKHQLLLKVIHKREIIWKQHKNDLRLFPQTAPGLQDRTNMSYGLYLCYNDNKRFHRLYESKYRWPPSAKVRVVIGQKKMVRVNHCLCTMPIPEDKKRFFAPQATTMPCYAWYGKRATPLNQLINQQFIYVGNVYTDILERLANNES